MELRELEYFKTVIDYGNISNAAKALFISQPTLSWNIQKLEAYYKTPLLVRTNKGVLPTATGKVLYDLASKILQDAKTIDATIEELAARVPQTIKVGLTPYTAVDYLYMFHEFQKKFPQFQIDITNCGSKKLQQLIVSGELDIALVSEPLIDFPFHKKKIGINHAFHDIGIILSNKHPLAHSTYVTMKDLVTYPLTTLSKDYVLFDAVSQKLETLEASTQLVFTNENWELLMQHVLLYDSIAILPDDCKDKINNKNLVWVPFKEHEFIRFSLYFIAATSKPMFSYFDPFAALFDAISRKQ